MSDVNESAKGGKGKNGIVGWLAAVTGWLVCAGMCLWLSIELEAWPYAYEMFFPAILLILFCNILVFLFVATRWAKNGATLAASTLRVCVGEGILLAGLYLLARFAIGS